VSQHCSAQKSSPAVLPWSSCTALQQHLLRRQQPHQVQLLLSAAQHTQQVPSSQGQQWKQPRFSRHHRHLVVYHTWLQLLLAFAPYPSGHPAQLSGLWPAPTVPQAALLLLLTLQVAPAPVGVIAQPQQQQQEQQQEQQSPERQQQQTLQQQQHPRR
jgi:hypothetical protein